MAEVRGLREPVTLRGRAIDDLFDLKWIAILALLGLGLFLTTVVYPGPMEERWPLYAALLAALGVKLVLVLADRSASVPPLELPPRAVPSPLGALQTLTETVSRAERGLPYSQALVALRVRHAFLEKMRSRRGLDEESLNALLHDPSALAATVPDATIVRFLSLTSREEELLYDTARPSGPLLPRAEGESYTRALGRVLQAMEAWE